CQIRGSRVKAIWAIGRIAYDFYRGIGYRPEQVFEWAYFPPVPADLPSREARSVPRIFYIGQFNERKGVDLLIAALERLHGKSWTAKL
ncbi:hypothetical protein ACSTJG_25160, partial [Vibrio parahaemolyticus]